MSEKNISRLSSYNFLKWFSKKKVKMSSFFKEFCESLVKTNFFKVVSSERNEDCNKFIPIAEMIFKDKKWLLTDKQPLRNCAEKCRYFYNNNLPKINEFLKNNYSGPIGQFNFSVSFKLKFAKDEIVSKTNEVNPNLMNNIRQKFSKVNTACKLKLYNKSIDINNQNISIVCSCGFDKHGCPVKYSFTLSDKTDEFIELVVNQLGPILHHTKATVKCYTTKNVRDELGKKTCSGKESY